MVSTSCVFSVRLSADVAAAARRLAVRQGRSVSRVIGELAAAGLPYVESRIRCNPDRLAEVSELLYIWALRSIERELPDEIEPIKSELIDALQEHYALPSSSKSGR